MDEWINKTLYILTMEYYSSLKIKELLHILQQYGKWNKPHIKAQMYDFTYMRHLE